MFRHWSQQALTERTCPKYRGNLQWCRGKGIGGGGGGGEGGGWVEGAVLFDERICSGKETCLYRITINSDERHLPTDPTV